MLRGYRFLIAAACGLVLLAALGTGAFFGALYSPDHKQYQTVTGGKSGQGDYHGPSQSLPDIAGLPGPFERLIANPRPPDTKDNDQRDLAAQEASALWAFWMVAATMASVLITAVGTIFLYKQIVLTREAVEDTGKATVAMERQNEITENTAKRQLRAYVSIEDVVTVGFQTGLLHGHRCKVVNRGQTPAYDLRIWSRPFAVITADGNVSLAKVPSSEIDSQSRTVLGPGQGIVHDNFSTGPLTESTYAGVSLGGITIIWAGAVSYRDAFGSPRRTTFKYYLTGDGRQLPAELDMAACSRGNHSN